MTDLEECRALLARLAIDYLFSDQDNSQGMESSYCTITLPMLGRRETQVWFFYNQVNPYRDPGKRTGDFCSTDHGMLPRQYWPLEEDEIRPYFLD